MLALAGNAPARTASRGAYRSVRSTSRRKASCELSADTVESLHAFVERPVPDPPDPPDIAQQPLLAPGPEQRETPIGNADACLRCTPRHPFADHFRAGNAS